MATPKTFRVNEIKSTSITNHKSYIQVLKEPIAVTEGIIVAFETNMRLSLDTQSKHQHKIGGLFIQKILAKTKKPSEFARYVPYANIATASQHKFINGIIGTEEERAYLEMNKLIKKIGNEPQKKAKGRIRPSKEGTKHDPKAKVSKTPRKKCNKRYIALADFVSTSKPTYDTRYRKRLTNHIDIDIGRVIGFDTVILNKNNSNPVPHHQIVYYYVQLKLTSGKYSNFVKRYLLGNISESSREFLETELQKGYEYNEFVLLNRELESKFNAMKEISNELCGKQGLIRKPLRMSSWAMPPTLPKEIERKFLPSTDEINGSWLNQVLNNFVSSKDINQAYVKLDTIKFHIAEDTVFLQSLNKTMNTPITAVTVGTENCIILRELFANTEKKAVRIRKQDQDFFFTIKLDIGKHGECVEIEVPIDLQTYTAIRMYCGREICKIRMTILHEDMKYEIDLFKHNIFGFTLIEVEVPAIDHPLNLPAWVGKEVTGDPTYFNSNLLRYNSYKDGVLSV